MHRIVSVLGNKGKLQKNFMRHLKRNCTQIDVGTFCNETWQTVFTDKVDKNACLGVVFYDIPSPSEDYVRLLSRQGIPYKRVWPMTVTRRTVETFGPPSPNIFLPNNPDWDAFIRDHTQTNSEIYV